MTGITTHVLDTALGRPAVGMPVLLERQAAGDTWTEVGRGVTDSAGRCANLYGRRALARGVHRLTFDTSTHYYATETATFFPAIYIVFVVDNTGEHFHVPLLLSPFGYTTYRGA